MPQACLPLHLSTDVDDAVRFRCPRPEKLDIPLSEIHRTQFPSRQIEHAAVFAISLRTQSTPKLTP